jgi:DNA-binding beta-propeller fold protein YncE
MLKCFFLLGLQLTITSVCAQHHFLLVVQQSEQTVAVVDLRTQKLLHRIAVGFKPHEIACDPVKKLCYVTDFGVEDYDTRLGTPGKTISVIDPIRGKRIQQIETTSDTAGNMPHGIKLRPGKKRELFINIEKGDSMLVLGTDNWKLIRKFSLPKGTHNFLFSANGTRLWLMCGAGGVAEIDPNDGRVIHQLSTATPIRGLSQAGTDLLASGQNEMYLLSTEDLSIRKKLTGLGVKQLFYAAMDPVHKIIIAPAAFDSTVLLLDGKSGTLIKRLSPGRTPLQVRCVAGRAYITHPLADHLSIIDLKSRSIAGQLPVKGGNGIVLFP